MKKLEITMLDTLCGGAMLVLVSYMFGQWQNSAAAGSFMVGLLLTIFQLTTEPK